MSLKDDLEPFYGLEVAAEICGCTKYALEHFLRKYPSEFPKQYHHDGTEGGRPIIVLMRSQIIEIRKMMLNGNIKWRDRAKIRAVGSRGQRISADVYRLKKSHFFEKPPAHWLLNNG